MLLFAPAHSSSFAHAVAKHLGVELAASEEREYEGGEHKIRPRQSVRGEDVFVLQSLCGDSQATANDKLCRLLFFIGALKDAGAARVTACLPFLAYSRKDRRTQPYDPVISRYVAAMFEAVRTDRIVALDVHNEAAFDNAFRCEALRIDAIEAFAEHLAGNTQLHNVVVASPDIGGVKRAQRFRDVLAKKLASDVGFAFMEKRRERGVVSGQILTGEVGDRNVVIVDDMISSGTTVLRAASAARRAGARRVVVMATHAALQPDAIQLWNEDVIDTVIVGDSVPLAAPFSDLPREKLSVCSLAPLFAQTIALLSRPANSTRL
jgi:ribose-phosphate pyrophosphokinase